MAEPKQRRVRMLVSWAGEGFGYQPDDEALLDEELAVALCTEPEDDPRAVPVGWELSEAAGAGERAPKRPARARRRAPEAATAETRETAAVPPAQPQSEHAWGDDDELS